MGLKVHSLARLPVDMNRDYYVYLLDWNWEGNLNRFLRLNFDKMASIAARNRAVVITGFDGEEFSNEVFSYHQVLGEDGRKALPAILVTTCNPHKFASTNNGGRPNYQQSHSKFRHALFDERMVLLPLRDLCTDDTDVNLVIDKIMSDIVEKKSLTEFEVYKKVSQKDKEGLADALILQPNFAGMGVDIKLIWKFLTGT